MANWLEVSFDSSADHTGVAKLGFGNGISLDKRLSYYREPGMTSLSYSRLKTLHACPRRFQLREKQQRQANEPSVHTAYGHAFGAGIQELWKSGSLEKAFFAALCEWDFPDLMAMEKGNKSFWDCLTGIQKYYNGEFQAQFAEYEIAQLPNGKRAVELFFVIRIGDKYSYQGHIDLVLQHRVTKQFCVFEIKTSMRDFHAAQWANSDQTLGYNVVMDFVGDHENVGNEYKVIYLCYHTTDEVFVPFEFSKSKKSKANFITTILLEVRTLELYEEFDFYPKNGDACYSGFNRTCQFFGTCDLEQMTQGAEGSDVYATAAAEAVDYFIDINALLDTQEKLLDEVMDNEVDFDNLPNGEQDA